MGALLVLVLAVSFSVGAVSAYGITDTYNINIVDGSLVLTENVASWPDPVTGDFVSAETAYGALRTGYVDLNKEYAATINFTSGAYTITTINGTSASDNYVWRAYVDGTYTANLMDVISTGTEVAFVLTNADVTEAPDYADYADEEVEKAIAFTVTINPVNVIYNSTFAGNGMTGKEVLEALDAAGAFDADISEPTSEYPYAWLNSINGISKNWTKTGYGYAVLLKENDSSTFNSTDALNSFTVHTGDILKIWMSPSGDGGHSSLPATGATQWSEGYYLDGATDRVTIEITA